MRAGVCHKLHDNKSVNNSDVGESFKAMIKALPEILFEPSNSWQIFHFVHLKVLKKTSRRFNQFQLALFANITKISL
jgi:hypothetical protein